MPPAPRSLRSRPGKNPDLNSALLQGAQFSNANLGNADFSSAYLEGVIFDYAILTNAVFTSAHLLTSADGTRPSFVGTNLQSASFDGATLSNIAFTNAAISVANPGDLTNTIPAGVWLFSLSQGDQSLVEPELAAASSRQFTLTLQALQQLQTPGPVGRGIVTSFAGAGITLTADAVLTIMGEGIDWQLTEGSTHYVISHSFDTSQYMPALGVSAGTVYTPEAQFFLPLSLEAKVKNGPVDPAVVAAFQSAGHPIKSSAQITVAQYPTDWQIINGAPNYDVYSLWLGVTSAGMTITARPAIPEPHRRVHQSVSCAEQSGDSHEARYEQRLET